MEVIKTTQGGNKLILNGYTYTAKKKNNGSQERELQGSGDDG